MVDLIVMQLLLVITISKLYTSKGVKIAFVIAYHDCQLAALLQLMLLSI